MEELGFINGWRVDVPGCPLRWRGDNIFYNGVEALWRILSPKMATDLLLEVVPLSVADYFFGAMTW